MKFAAMFLFITAWSISVHGAEPNSKVLLLPFAPLGEDASTLWIGQAIQQNLLAELSRFASIQPITPIAQSAAVSDNTQAQQAGQAANATFVIFGSYQNTEAGLRLTGQVLDVQSGRLIGGMKATGTLRDLFFLEDTLAEQVKRILAKQMQPPQTQPAASQPPTPQTTNLTPPQTPWQRQPDWMESTRLRERYDADYYRSRYGYIYSTGPGWYGYSPYSYGYRCWPCYGTNGWAYQGGW